MKLYHIDRSGNLSCGILNLRKEVSINMDTVIGNMFENNLKRYHQNGISFHGEHYYANKINDISFMIDIVFEYERLLNFPNNISRYESFFAFDKAGVLKFLSENQIEDYKIYEVESKYCEKHNMRLLKGNVNFIMSKLANDYWNCTNRYNIELDNPLYEYLLQFPVHIIKEVKIDELK